MPTKTSSTMRLIGYAIALGSLACALQAAHAAGASFECGGVGKADQARIQAMAAQHDALLTFAESTGAYLADVQVRITDSKGAEVLQARCEGPLMLLKLPAPGSYTVTATANGEAKTRTLSTGRGSARAVFTWAARG